MEIIAACLLVGGLYVASTMPHKPTVPQSDNKTKLGSTEKTGIESSDVLFQNHVLNQLDKITRILRIINEQNAENNLFGTGISQPVIEELEFESNQDWDIANVPPPRSSASSSSESGA